MSKKYIEFEQIEYKQNFSMARLHSHSHFELYFLEKGTRQMLFSDRLIEIKQNDLVIIPPYIMHKTEGGACIRTNVNIAPENLSSFEYNVLMDCYKKTVLPLSSNDANEIKKIVAEALHYATMNIHNSDFTNIKQSLVHYLIFLLYKQVSLPSLPTVQANTSVPPLVLQILAYINENYMNEVSLVQLSKKFYVSTVTICRQFKKYVHSTIGEYLMDLRLNKAKELLASDKKKKKSMDEIAMLCGFSSANYFSLIFKQQIGIAPSTYRKYEIEK